MMILAFKMISLPFCPASGERFLNCDLRIRMYPLPYVLICVTFKDPAPVNQHMLVQAQQAAQQLGATVQLNRQPAPAPTTYMTAFDEHGSFVAYKLEKEGVLPAMPLVKSATDPYKSWTLSTSFMVNMMRGQRNWEKVEFGLYIANADQPSFTSERDLSQQMNNHGMMNHGMFLPHDIGDLHHEMMNMVSCMSETAPDERLIEAE